MLQNDTNATIADELSSPGIETFWRSYNRNLEFPIASLMSILAHVAIVAVLIGVLLLMMNAGNEKASVAIALVDDGSDHAGKGNPSNGGDKDSLAVKRPEPAETNIPDAVPINATLPDVQKEIQKHLELKEDLAKVKDPGAQAAAAEELARTLREKLFIDAQKGKGKAGPVGPEGNGVDGIRARSLRWVLRFRTTSGRDYLDQLASLGAVVVVPIPPANATAYLFRDLVNPRVGPLVSEEEWKKLTQQIQFCDFTEDSVKQVAAVLGVSNIAPRGFWAFFPPELEKKLADMERRYQGKEAKDIEETVFAITIRNGQNELTVVRQTLKR